MTIRHYLLRALSLALATSAAVAAPASAEAWDCRDTVKVDGVHSHYSAAFHGPREPEPFGAFFQIGWKGFYAGWPGEYKTFEDPFVAPRSMVVNVYIDKHLKRGTGEWRRDGVEPIMLQISNTYVRRSDKQQRAFFRVEDAEVVKALLAHRNWEVVLRDRRGRVVETAQHSFAHDLDGIRALYNGRVAKVRDMAKDIRANCQRDLTEELFTGG